jgi:hypothetical protein
LLKKSESKYWLNQVPLLKRLRLGLSVQTKDIEVQNISLTIDD